MTPAVRHWDPGGPYDLLGNLRVLCRGPADPTHRVRDGEVWRAARTPHGPVTLQLSRDGHGVRARAWGSGAEWALDQLPELLGETDAPREFVPRHRSVRLARHTHPGMRLVRTGMVMESLIPSVLEQKVTAVEAYRAWRLLVRRFGEPAPGPPERQPPGMYVMPAPRDWRRIPSWEWHRAGVDSKRSEAVLRACRVAPRLQEAAAMELPDALRRLRLVTGIGPWTAAETLQRSNGAPDAVTVGDLHLPGTIGYALTGRRGLDDEAMLQLLAPYAGQRHRVTRLLLAAGPRPPRRAPRFPVGDIAGL